jgi:RNA polymerase sigma factor (sigma-70 family)
LGKAEEAGFMGGDRLARVIQRLRHRLSSTEGDGLSDAELLRRWVTGRDEAAFEVLLWRHGPMVLGVCRRVLGDLHDAEDAFQATFWVLACKATSIHRHESLAAWLHGVAQRMSLKARNTNLRRRGRERRSAVKANTEPVDEQTWEELRLILDEELGRLPEKYRAPVVLCYLEGKTNEQAARELGCPKSSLSSRLGRARELLRERLMQRGVTLSASAVATLLMGQTATAGLPARAGPRLPSAAPAANARRRGGRSGSGEGRRGVDRQAVVALPQNLGPGGSR